MIAVRGGAPFSAGKLVAVLCVAVMWLLASAPAAALEDLQRCTSIADDASRLRCYDAALGRGTPDHAGSTGTTPEAPAAIRAERDAQLAADWELRPGQKRGTFNLLPYRAVYLLAHRVNNINASPDSPTRPPSADDIHLDRTEAKLQLSFKSKLLENPFGSRADVWFGYTQQSFWQAANSRYSSPFRETNYQPEVIVIRPWDLADHGVDAAYVGASFTHESNGRGQSLSRSWNRLIGEVAVARGPWSLQVRPWVRVDTSTGSDDDNPDISDYVGRGEIIATYRERGHTVTLTARHSLRAGENSRGSARLDWAFPLAGKLNGHVQFFTGYGESLIDYNHYQTSLGLGVSFFD